MTAQIQQLTSELTLERINEIPVLTLNHPVGSARIALQGAQLLHKVSRFVAVYRFVTLGLVV